MARHRDRLKKLETHTGGEDARAVWERVETRITWEGPAEYYLDGQRVLRGDLPPRPPDLVEDIIIDWEVSEP